MRFLNKFIIFCFLFIAVANAQWSADPKQPKQIATSTSNPQEIYLLKNGKDGFFLLWQDVMPGGRARMLLNYFSSRGESARTTNGVEVEGYYKSQSAPKVSSAVNGKVAFCWLEGMDDGSKWLFVQQANSGINFKWTAQPAGVPVTKPDGGITEYAVSLDIASSSNVGWIEKSSSGNYSVRLNRVDAEGSLRFSKPIQLDDGGTQKVSLNVLPAPNSGAGVVWIDLQGGKSVINFAFVDSTGKTEVSKVISTVEGIVKSLSVITLKNGDHYLIWEAAGKTKEIFHQLISAKGSERWSKGGRKAVTGKGTNSAPVAVEGSDSSIVVSWINEAAGNDDILVQKFDRKGVAKWAFNGVSIGNFKDKQFSQVIDCDNNGAVLIAWLDKRAGAPEIYLQKIDRNGKIEWEESAIPVSASGNPDKSYLQLMFDGKDGAIIVYKEKSRSANGIYAVRIPSNRQTPQGIVDAWLTYNDDEVKINWTATNEGNVKGYFVHRMQPKVKDTSWIEIDNVVAYPGAKGAYYTFDTPDGDGAVTYRVTQISKDNKVVAMKYVQGNFTRKSTQKIYVGQNVPNPFTNETTISYNVSGAGTVTFEFFDSGFKLVKKETIQISKGGTYSYVFKAEGLKAGIYFYRFTYGNFIEVKKMAVI
ncbi:MAG: T9SS type A sorting domain-containing protein [Ignavibacteriales bacterium]|nr:MAG: T9SS type A sorting domain-containing protein [Ignavibacteriaceae bacterium]MBW7874284.1 T9SS type A sorting domain-containing protein [Ignavibacteria bacterium]MCZ2142672.1 T9SS type A sorting domain-containing protein [Ignavibacteriales bacterium]OQY71017.1 MAG: hypothetical protein B6D45_10545 [Ignavibacteriales bacterium UTCHB3]MBV6443770.1 hypothetical protein [Ignavibacteriaceae bacterium]